MEIDIKAAQLLNSRLFHDLLGAVTAINNGIEFISEPGADGNAVHLLKYSADRLTRRIDFFRGAFGFGGGNQGDMSMSQAGVLVNGWFADSKSDLNWPDEKTSSAFCMIEPLSVKILMILAMIAEEALPRGGEVTVQVTNLSEGLGITVTASGHGAGHPDGVEQAFRNLCGRDDLSARNIVSYVCVKLANSLNARIDWQQSEAKVEYAMLIPRH